MRDHRIFLAIFSLAALLCLAIPFAIVRGEPLAVDCINSGFISPVPGAVLAGTVEIRGRANVPGFRFYKVEFSVSGKDDWALIGPDVIRTPVQEGRLVLWQTTTVPDGVYRLRMHVVDPTGNYCEIFLQPITVANGAPPTASATPTATETAILTVVPPQTTLTLSPAAITDISPLQTPALPIGNRGLPLPDINVLAFGSFFLLGVCGMGSVIALIVISSRWLNRAPTIDKTDDSSADFQSKI